MSACACFRSMELKSRAYRVQTYLNVLGVAATYAERIIRELGSEAYLEQYYDGEEEMRDISIVLQTLEGVSNQLRGVLRVSTL